MNLYHFTLCAQCTTIYSHQPIRGFKLEFTLSEICQLSNNSRVYRDDCERKMRRIRRNKEKLQSDYLYMLSVDPDGGYIAPDFELNYLKERKAEATILIKKLDLMKLKINGEY